MEVLSQGIDLPSLAVVASVVAPAVIGFAGGVATGALEKHRAFIGAVATVLPLAIPIVLGLTEKITGLPHDLTFAFAHAYVPYAIASVAGVSVTATADQAPSKA